MNKQEFLSMSLPYGLKLMGSDGSIALLTTGHGVSLGEYSYEWVLRTDKSKLILRPLSDLTKPIEHKGETFVPIEKLNEMFGYEECKLVYYINSGLGWGIDSGFCSTAITFSDMYLPIQKLLEWHFDIANLISKGEAIDVNSLDINPYK